MTTTGNHAIDLQLTPKQISDLASADAIAAFFTSLGYDTGARTSLTAEAIGLAGESAAALNSIEVLSEDREGFLRVVFVRLRSLTARSRNDLARVLGKANVDHLLVLTSDFDTLEFVLLDKRKRQRRGPAGQTRVQVVPLALAVERKSPGTKELRTLRRFTWTCRDGLEQFDKLRSVFEAAAYSEEYFCNRALFADHFLVSRLREDRAWRDNPTAAFQQVKSLMRDARQRFLTKGEQHVREQLYEPLFNLLGFKHKALKTAEDARTRPDYILTPKSGDGKTAAFVYAWDRWLDGPDFHLDQETSEENPGACVVTALEKGVADWIVVTNGRQWRLYSRAAHSRATNFYEVDLAEALVASGDTDPNEAFRYWWLFFRSEAFGPAAAEQAGCWLDAIAQGSRDYAKQLGQRLKNRVFVDIFPYLARGFLEDRKRRLGIDCRPSEEELHDTYEATLTLLYRLLFLLFAEARDLLPIREAPYREASLKKIKEEIAEKAGIAESEVPARLAKAYTASDTVLYDRVVRLCEAMDLGDPSLNVPIYNGGLFITNPAARPQGEDRGEGSEARGQRIARYLAEHKVPDRYLALAIDRLARDADQKTLALVFIDYKSLEVRHLGSIYEGLLEFKLKIAAEDLTTKTEKKREKYIPLGKVKPKRGKMPEAVVRAGEVYLSNDKAERKASGSYYTPDPIVQYIVEHTVGPVLAEKLEKLRPGLRKVRKTFANEVAKAQAYPVKKSSGETWAPRDFAAEKTYVAHRNLVEDLFDFRTLDPAMGSGHFLVEAVDFITDRLLTFLNQFPVNPVTFMLERTRRNILEALGDQGVAVDPDKLTEVNLLKRHVLKRCIYGVDLNPMAVELAKVSLWLDAFTIGAPLSFLDHHLRCGNSLIGATFEDLELLMRSSKEATLFGIDYEPLLRAIHHVLQVNKMADATAAEVKQSTGEYTAARRDLSGYQIVLDLLVAGHFGYPKASSLLEFGSELDLSNRDRFLESLLAVNITQKDETPATEVVDEVSTLAGRPDLRFFHWEIEFPEVFFGFEDPNQRRLKHKEKISEGSAGFDAVVGNPPYVRMELIKPLKPFLKTHYRCHAERADLFIYFYERAVDLLSRGGYSAFIASSTWTRTKAGEGLRGFLASQATVESFVDFGDLPVFPEATTYPCVLVLHRLAPTSNHEVRAAVVPSLTQMNLNRLLARSDLVVPQNELDNDGWRFESPAIRQLREKITAAGVPLKDYCGSPLRGIVSGLNEAFVVDSLTRDRLVSEDTRSEEILKPFLEGKDLKRWRYDWRGLWLIYTHHGVDIDRYPAIEAHLSTFRKRLERRATSDHHEWYELQQPQFVYGEHMMRPKIMYPDITVEPRFVFDERGFFFGNTTYFIPGADRFLQGLLQSNVLWWNLTGTVRLMRGGYLRLFTQYVEAQPVPMVTAEQKDRIGRIAEQLSAECCPDRLALEHQLNKQVADLFGLDDRERELISKSLAGTAS